MGVEPTRDSDYRPADGFEDREAHRDPSASRENKRALPRDHSSGTHLYRL